MDRLISADFRMPIEELMARSIVRDFKKIVLAGDTPEIPEDVIPWMPFSILAMVNGRQQRFNGLFRIKQEMDEWLAETSFDLKGFSGKKFKILVDNSGDAVGQAILEFCTGRCKDKTFRLS